MVDLLLKIVEWLFKHRENSRWVERSLADLKEELVARYTAALKSDWTNAEHSIPVSPADAEPYKRLTSHKSIPEYVLLSGRGTGKTVQMLRSALDGASKINANLIAEGRFELGSLCISTSPIEASNQSPDSWPPVLRRPAGG
jgi:hypothetical protein